MSTFKTVAMMGAVTALLTVSAALEAQLVVGTWVRTPTKTAPGQMTMTIEPCCGSGYKLTYRFAISEQQTMLMTVSSPFDGSEVPVLVDGKPSGETMAIKRIDDHHATTVLRMNGELFGTSKSTLSADGKTISVINDVTNAAVGQPVGKVTETWVRQ
jgi:hypothetical protein